MPDAPVRSFLDFQRSHAVRLVVVFVLILALQIPIALIDGLVSERKRRHAEATEEITSKWGKAQTLVGPAMIVPYRHRWTELGAGGRQVGRLETRYACFLPERLDLVGELQGERRSRGIFSVPVYRLSLDVRGEFDRPDFASLDIDSTEALWEQSELCFGVADPRAIQEETVVGWGGARVAFLPGAGHFDLAGGSGIHAPLTGRLSGRRTAFETRLVLSGSQRVTFAPFGRTTRLHLQSSWNSPSFQGNWLPQQRTVTSRGFEADWSVASLGRNYPQAWLAEAAPAAAVAASGFGVDLIETVDARRMTERSIKYAALFTLLTFAFIWLTEVLAAVRVHPIQYLLLGSALCLFYLLELSLSEHLGFGAAYAIASLAVVVMVSAYGKTVLGSPGRGLALGGVVALLYGYLHVLLRNEDYALLVGSIGLFVVLGLIMFLTRRVDWSGPAGRSGAAAG